MTRLCHYTSAKNAIKILSSQQFKLGHLEHSNDPFENLSKRYDLSFNVQEPVRTFMNKVFDFSDTQLSYASFSIIKEGVNNDQNWIMWAHYANKHSGVCLTFDLENFIDELKRLSVFFVHDKIIYSNALLIPPNYFEDRIHYKPAEVLNEFNKFLLLSKHMGWESESEYRIVVFDKEIRIPIHSCLKQVLFGPEISNWSKSRIENLLKKNNFNGPFGKLHYAFASYAKPLTFFFKELKENS